MFAVKTTMGASHKLDESDLLQMTTDEFNARLEGCDSVRCMFSGAAVVKACPMFCCSTPAGRAEYERLIAAICLPAARAVVPGVHGDTC